jgi:hypothetical protein
MSDVPELPYYFECRIHLTLKIEFAMKNTFASRYISLFIKFTAKLAKPLVLQGKLCFCDFLKRRKLYLEFKTHPNFQ